MGTLIHIAGDGEPRLKSTPKGFMAHTISRQPICQSIDDESGITNTAAVQRTLVIFLKEPHPGRVKTRLGRDIGMTAAAWWFRHQSTRLIRRLGGDRRWQTVLAVSPDHEGLASRVWPSRLPRC